MQKDVNLDVNLVVKTEKAKNDINFTRFHFKQKLWIGNFLLAQKGKSPSRSFPRQEWRKLGN